MRPTSASTRRRRHRLGVCTGGRRGAGVRRIRSATARKTPRQRPGSRAPADRDDADRAGSASRLPQIGPGTFCAIRFSRAASTLGVRSRLLARSSCAFCASTAAALLLALVGRDPEADAGHRAHHRPDGGQPPPRQLQQPRHEHADARGQRPRPRAGAVHQPGHDDDAAEVPHPSAQQPVQAQQPEQEQHAEPDQPRDPRPPRERPQQQRGRPDGQARGAAARTGEPLPGEGRCAAAVGGRAGGRAGRPGATAGDRGAVPSSEEATGSAHESGRFRRAGRQRRVSTWWKPRCARDGVGPRWPW